MKVVLVTADADEYDSAVERLIEAGIPVVEQRDYLDYSGIEVGPRFHTVRIWLDDQYEDAVRVLRTNTSIVRNPIEPERFAEIQEEAEVSQQAAVAEFWTQILNWAVPLAAALLVGSLILRLLAP